MANSVSNITEIVSSVELKEENVLTYSEKLQKIAKIKHNLGIFYFTLLVVLLSTLFI